MSTINKTIIIRNIYQNLNKTADGTEVHDLYNATNATDQDILLENEIFNLFNALNNRPTISSQEYIIIAFYSVIILISIFGNLLVCNILARSSRMRSSTYIFIGNLALSDILLTVLNIPFNAVRLILPNWPFGSFVCSFLPLVQVSSVYVSTFTMTCIAGDRFRMVKYPLKPKTTRAQAIRIIVLVWILAILLALPHVIFNKVEEVFTYRHMTRCRTIYPVNMGRWIIVLAVSTQYVLPLSITGVYYWRIMVRIWSRDTLGVVTEAQLIVQARTKRKTIKMLLLVVILFAICWLPLNVFNILREFDALEFVYNFPKLDALTVFFMCHWLAMSSVCYNPFIYCWLNDHFRSGAYSCLLCIKSTGQRLNSSLRSTVVSRLSSKPKSEKSEDDTNNLRNNDSPSRVVHKTSKRRWATCRLVRQKSIPMCSNNKTEFNDLALEIDGEGQSGDTTILGQQASNDV